MFEKFYQYMINSKVICFGLFDSDDEGIVDTRYISRYGGRAHHSDIDSDTDLSDSDVEIGRHAANVRRQSSSSAESHKGWLSWCIIV